MSDVPEIARAIQLTGPDRLELNAAKPVPHPGRGQLLAKVEAVGLCYSDLKLLKQFSQHGRKSGVASGMDAQALAEMPHYVPGEKPAVPGHEAVVRIVKVGEGVDHYKVGERYVVETDYRWLRTATTNAAFGYNFEGGLQEFVLFDERVITSPDGESMLIPAPEDLSASALALVEPWACVEHAYGERQRRELKYGGAVLVIHDADVDAPTLEGCPGRPASKIFADGDSLAQMADGGFDDIVYFGANPEMVEKLSPRLNPGGLMVIVQGGRKFGRPVNVQVGRVHYGGIRIVGTAGADPAAAFAAIPESAEVRPGDRINIVGAAGPMGAMHVIRILCQGASDVAVYAGDLNEERLARLSKLAAPLAEKNGLTFVSYNPAKDALDGTFNYTLVVVPVAALAAQAIASSSPNAIINLFAGIPADVAAPIDLNAYVEKQLYFIGTSGSELRDMQRVLAKVVARELDTNLSVAAVAGLDGAIEGIRAVEKNLVGGKILIYPSCRGLKLTALGDLQNEALHEDGRWSGEAEAALLRRFAVP